MNVHEDQANSIIKANTIDALWWRHYTIGIVRIKARLFRPPALVDYRSQALTKNMCTIKSLHYHGVTDFEEMYGYYILQLIHYNRFANLNPPKNNGITQPRKMIIIFKISDLLQKQNVGSIALTCAHNHSEDLVNISFAFRFIFLIYKHKGLGWLPTLLCLL